MIYNFLKMMFMLILMLSTMFSISSNSWFGMWMGLEINLMSFIMIIYNYKNIFCSEISIKYFMVQALSSSLMMFSIIFLSMNLNYVNYFNLILNFSLILKLGIAPMHSWFVEIMEKMNWLNIFLLMTWQKIAPLIILSYCMNLYLMIIIIVFSVIIGSVGGINLTSIRMIFSFSSINNMGWLVMSMTISENLWNLYFIIYMFLNFSLIIIFAMMKIFHINQSYSIININSINKFFLMLNILSLGGLPPFLGFLPKWMTIKLMIYNNLIMLSLLMLLMSLITLYYYLQINFSSLMLNYYSQKWNMKNLFNNNLMNLINLLTFISMFFLFIMSLMINF